MRFGIIIGLALLWCSGLLVQAQQPGKLAATKHKHPHLHHALWALHHAHHELKVSKEHYAGHKEHAMRAIHGAIKNIEAILRHEKDHVHSTPSRAQLTEAHKKYAHHPHLHHAINEVKSAHHELKISRDNFGGHRTRALHDMDHAVQQMQLILRHANHTVAKR